MYTFWFVLNPLLFIELIIKSDRVREKKKKNLYLLDMTVILGRTAQASFMCSALLALATKAISSPRRLMCYIVNTGMST